MQIQTVALTQQSYNAGFNSIIFMLLIIIAKEKQGTSAEWLCFLSSKPSLQHSRMANEPQFQALSVMWDSIEFSNTVTKPP